MENFEVLNLSAPLLRAIHELGYVKPSPIQAETLPVLLGEPTDFIGLAATGTGKTAAFSIPLLTKVQANVKAVQVVILCPTRELCVQVTGQVNLLGKYLGVRALAIYGGTGYADQLRGLKGGFQVVVGTPGRVIDHMQRGTLRLEAVHTAILDEADEMISMGFREAMEEILEKVPRETSQIWLFSATMSTVVRKVADVFLRKPKMVQINRSEMLSSTVEQSFYMTQEKNKPEVLCKLVDAAEDFYGVVFCQTKELVVNLSRYLNERGYRTGSLHGDMSQAAREATLLDFRSKRLKILVCTDVAARGLDVKDVTHVINYSIPRELDSYVHRIGRTARSGKSGYAMSLVTPSHRHLLYKIEQRTRSKIKEGEIPTRRSLGEKKVARLLEPWKTQAYASRALEVMSKEWREALAGLTPEEVAGRFLAMMHPEVFSETPRPQLSRTPSSEAGEERSASGGSGGPRPPRRWQPGGRKPDRPQNGNYPPRKRHIVERAGAGGARHQRPESRG